MRKLSSGNKTELKVLATGRKFWDQLKPGMLCFFFFFTFCFRFSFSFQPIDLNPRAHIGFTKEAGETICAFPTRRLDGRGTEHVYFDIPGSAVP